MSSISSFNEKLPLISIIIPSFNQGEYLEECILSVLNQKYLKTELIVCDGGSSDNSVEIIKKYSNKIKFWYSEPDNGQAAAISKGMKYCSGDVINWLNSDDYYESDALIKVGYAFINQNTNIYCGISRVFGMGNSRFSNGSDIYFNNLEKTIGMARIDQPETFFRRSTWLKLGGPNVNFRYLMDRELWIRYLIEFGLNGVVKTNEHLVNFRMHPNSKTVSEQSGFDIEDKILFEWLFNYFEENSTISFNLNSSQKYNFNAEKVINYRYYGKILDFYFKNSYQEFDENLSKINWYLLSFSEKLNLLKLISRRKLVPLYAKKIYNNLF